MRTARDGANPGRILGIVAAIAFALPFCLFSLRDLQLPSDDARRLPGADPHRRLHDWHASQLGNTDTLLVTWPGSTIDDPRISQLEGTLLGHMDADGVRRGGAPEIADVATPGEVLQRIEAEGVSRDAAVQRLTGVLIGRGGLKIALTKAGRDSQAATSDRLIRAVRNNLGIDLEVTGAVEAWTAQATDDDPAAVAPIPMRDHDLQITWSGFHPQSTAAAQVRALALSLTDFPTADEPDGRKLVADCFLAPGSPVGLQVELSPAGAADVPAAVRAIERAAHAVDLPAVHVVGLPLEQAELSRGYARALWNAAAPWWRLQERSQPLLAAAVLTVLTCIAVRSLRMGLLLSGASLAVALLSAASLRLAGPVVDPILLVVPILCGLLLLAGGMQLAVSRRGLELNGDPASDGLHTLASVAVFRTATIIAALVLAPLMISSTPAVRQLGMFGSLSALIVLVLGVSVLPPVLAQLSVVRRAGRDDAARWGTIAAIVTRRPALTTILCLALLLGGAAGAGRMKVQGNHVRTLPADSRLAADTRFVEDNLTGTAPLNVVVRFAGDSLNDVRFLERVEIVRAAEAAIESHPAVVGALSLADRLAVSELPPADASTRARAAFKRRSNDAEERVRSGEVPGAAALLRTADAAADWQTVGDRRLSNVGDELWRIQSHLVLPDGVDVQQVSQEVDAAVRQVLRRHPAADHVVTGPALLADAVRRTFLRSLAKTSGLACLLLIGALIWLLRTPAAILGALLINVLPIACVLGLASWRGVRLDVSAMAAVVVALALGSQAGVQMLIWFRGGIQDGDAHPHAGRQSLVECGAGTWRFAIVAVGLGLALRTSELDGVARFGGMLSALLAVTTLANIVLLPALLAGRVGQWYQASLRNRTPAAVHEDLPSPHVRFEPSVRDAVRPAV